MKRTQRVINGVRVNGYILDGEFYRTKREAGLAVQSGCRKYRNADASLVQMYLVNKEFSTAPTGVLLLYAAAVALVPDWDSRESGKVQQLFLLSKVLPDYTPQSVQEYLDCSGTEGRRLSKALRSVQSAVLPYALSEQSWVYDSHWFNEVNILSNGVAPGYSAPVQGFHGDKIARLALVDDLVLGEFGGLSELVHFPDDWCSDVDTGSKLYRDRCIELGLLNTETGELLYSV